eukprot:COSAG06_NODE_2241_length_7269_cov_9.419944_3_plen_70_part_00
MPYQQDNPLAVSPLVRRRFQVRNGTVQRYVVPRFAATALTWREREEGGRVVLKRRKKKDCVKVKKGEVV